MGGLQVGVAASTRRNLLNPVAGFQTMPGCEGDLSRNFWSKTMAYELRINRSWPENFILREALLALRWTAPR